MSKKLNKKGFTLIEVVLTIAIGALIFLLAFIAFRNAQVNRRDSQRRSDLDKVGAEIQNYASDHNGKVPTNAGFEAFLTTYTKGLNDPRTTSAYKYGANDDADPADAISDTASAKINYKVVEGSVTSVASCEPGAPALTAKNSYVVKMKLEKGVACRDSSTQ